MPELEPTSGPAHRCKHGNDWLTCDVCAKAARASARFASDPDDTSPEATARQWIIQRCINAFRNEYEDWPGYCERLLNRREMMAALHECEDRWPEHEFRGHNVANQRPGRDRLRNCAISPKPLRYVVLIGRSGQPPHLYDTETKTKVRPYPTVAEAEHQAMLLNRYIRPGLHLPTE